MHFPPTFGFHLGIVIPIQVVMQGGQIMGLSSSDEFPTKKILLVAQTKKKGMLKHTFLHRAWNLKCFNKNCMVCSCELS